jgi:hypothetical protein
VNTQKVVIEFTIPTEWDGEDFVNELIGCYCDTAGWDDETDQSKADIVQYEVKEMVTQ